MRLAIEVRKRQGDVKLTRAEFERWLRERFYDPAFQNVEVQIADMVDVAWKARLLRTVRDEPRCARPRRRGAAGGAERGQGARPGGRALARRQALPFTFVADRVLQDLHCHRHPRSSAWVYDELPQ